MSTSVPANALATPIATRAGRGVGVAWAAAALALMTSSATTTNASRPSVAPRRRTCPPSMRTERSRATSRPALAQESADLLDRRTPFGKEHREGVPDVDHVVPHIEGDVDAGGARPFGEPG